MSQFSQGIRDFMGIAQLAEQLNAQDAAMAQRARYEQMAQAQFQQQQAELLHRRQMEDAGRAVWLNQIDRLGGFTDLGSQQGGVAGAGSPAPVPPVGPGQYGPLQQGQQFAPPAGPQGLPTTGPLTLEQQMAQSFQPQESPVSMLTGLSRQALAGASPQLVQQIAETMMAEQDRARQLRAKSDMEFQSWHRGELERKRRVETIRSEGRKYNIPQEDVDKTIYLNGLSEAGMPAGVIGQLGERMWPEPQEYQRTADDYRTLLGMPGPAPSGEYGPFQPGAEPAMGQDQADVMARWQMSPTEAARFIPDAGQPSTQPQADVAELASHIKTIIPNISDEQARAIVMLRQNDMPFGLPDANLSGETRTKASEADKVVLEKIATSLRQADYGDDIVALEHEYRDQYERTYGQPFPIPVDYAGLARTEARIAARAELGDKAKPKAMQKRVAELSAELEREWRSQYEKPATGQGGATGAPLPSIEEIVAGDGPAVFDDLLRRLGRVPTEDELTAELMRRGGGG